MIMVCEICVRLKIFGRCNMYSYKTTCPSCGGDNLYVTPENGIKYCFNCTYVERDGNVPVEEKVRGPIGEIRAFYKQLVDYYHSCLTKSAREYLNKRGIPDTLIEKYKLGYCPTSPAWFYNDPIAKESGIVNEVGNPALADRIIFPYWYKGTVFDLRGRAINPLEEIRYKSPHGRKYYRGADYPFAADSMHKTHVLVEGEIKALVIESIGIPAVGIPGITITYDKYSADKYIICYDSEAVRQKQHDVNRGIMRAATWGVDPHVMSLPLLGLEKIGADDFILARGKEEFYMRYNMAVPFAYWKRFI